MRKKIPPEDQSAFPQQPPKDAKGGSEQGWPVGSQMYPPAQLANMPLSPMAL